MKNYKFHLVDINKNVIATAYSLKTVLKWLRLKSVFEEVWDSKLNKQISFIDKEFQTIIYK